MKKIEAIIRKTKFEEVKEALLAADIEWFSYYDVRGIGKSRQARIYRGANGRSGRAFRSSPRLRCCCRCIAACRRRTVRNRLHGRNSGRR